MEKHLSFNGDASSFLKSAITFEKNWFEVEWKSKHRTPPVEKRIKKICEYLKINISKESTLEIASKFENMEVEDNSAQQLLFQLVSVVNCGCC